MCIGVRVCAIERKSEQLGTGEREGEKISLQKEKAKGLSDQE